MKYIYNLAYTTLLCFASLFYAYKHNIPACIGFATAVLWFVMFNIESKKNKHYVK